MLPASPRTTRPSSAAPSRCSLTWEQTLAARIGQRIEKRLGPRVRQLQVDVTDKSVVLKGRCSTYYSKQLAQHAALGAIEDERLVNEIEVVVG